MEFCHQKACLRHKEHLGATFVRCLPQGNQVHVDPQKFAFHVPHGKAQGAKIAGLIYVILSCPLDVHIETH